MAKLPWSAVDIGIGIVRIYRNKVDRADMFHMTDRLQEVMDKRFHNRRVRAKVRIRISEWWTSWVYGSRHKEGDRSSPLE